MKAAALFLFLLVPASVEGQGPRHSIPMPPPDTLPLRSRLLDTLPEHGDLTLAFGGAMGGVGGILMGGLVGARLELAGGCTGDWCGFGGAVLGAAIGSTAVIPAAVHLANDQRGDYTADLAASVAALGGGIAISLIAQDARPMLLVPLAQIIGAVASEKRTSRRQERDASAPTREIR